MGLAVGIVVFAHAVVARDEGIRKKITSQWAWKLQFFCHPLVMFMCVMLGQGSLPVALFLVPFAVNWAVEPWDLPQDVVFYGFFYLHHAAPIMMVCLDDHDTTRRLAQALLLGHAWLLHPMSTLERWKLIDKGRWLWPYVGQGFVLKCLWWRALGAGGGAPFAFVASLPIAAQYVGRWGLYLRIQALMGWPGRTHQHYDFFEHHKQLAELVAFAASFVFTRLVA